MSISGMLAIVLACQLAHTACLAKLPQVRGEASPIDAVDSNLIKMTVFFRAQQFEIRSGRKYVVRIYPTVHKASEAFKKITIEKRQCRFTDEPLENQGGN
jgi:hypothetical protein